jgi:hypothetical protein
MATSLDRDPYPYPAGRRGRLPYEKLIPTAWEPPPLGSLKTRLTLAERAPTPTVLPAFAVAGPRFATIVPARPQNGYSFLKSVP